MRKFRYGKLGFIETTISNGIALTQTIHKGTWIAFLIIGVMLAMPKISLAGCSGAGMTGCTGDLCGDSFGGSCDLQPGTSQVFVGHFDDLGQNRQCSCTGTCPTSASDGCGYGVGQINCDWQAANGNNC